MRPSLHEDTLVRIISKNQNNVAKSVPISQYSPRDYLENSFDRMFSCQKSLSMERRDDDLYRIYVGEHNLAGSEELLIAGLYGTIAVDKIIPKPYISISLNLSDIASRRRVRVRLHYDDDESISAKGLKTLFPKRKNKIDERSKSYYYMWEVEEFLDRVNELSESVPVIAGIDRVWIPEEIRKDSELDSFSFIPVIPISSVGFLDSVEPEYTVRVPKGSRSGSPTLYEITDYTEEEGLYDFYFPEGVAREPFSKSPSRSCFTANGFLVFTEIRGYDPSDFADLYKSKRKEIESGSP